MGNINGASALGISDLYGNIEVGKRCGINILQKIEEDNRLKQETTIQKIA